MFERISIFIQYLLHLPALLWLLLGDLVKYIRTKGWTVFYGWGLHIYVGEFGATKTSSIVHDAYQVCKRYPQVTLLTNFKIMNFPEHTKILPLTSPQDILNAPNNTLVLIDEISTIFNSRDFAKSKQSVPKILFQHLCQCRKRNLEILATAQNYDQVDAQLRKITATVRVCVRHFGHPFTRASTVWKYRRRDYDRALSSANYPLLPIGAEMYLQTDKLRGQYDTDELVQSMLSAEYISDEEILANMGAAVVAPSADPDPKAGRRTARRVDRLGV